MPTPTEPDDDPIRAARGELEATGVDALPSHASLGEATGDVIDRYTLVREIGAGGMGAVWEAEQHEPVRRSVALKVIKLGMDTREVVVRFEAERQALALMDHPHIAKVLDGGATEAGRPYFVMELVQGDPITEYCDEQRLGLRARLELFCQVCDAIQHAHQKGVIHRDVKPTNVLVATIGGKPVPKVIDFGIAKATSAELTQKTLFTQHAQVIGTPEYMAPEQAELSGLDIDTRADVYALGALLNELLTGAKLFDMRRVLEAGYEELLRTIREVEPPRPSTRISTLGESASPIAANRHVNVAALTKRLAGDLDWIVMKALEKDRGRRYETASAFAADVARFLNQEPVEAAPPGAAYRLRKFVRRHRVGVGLSAVVLGLVAVGMTTILIQSREIAKERDRAAKEARSAQRIAGFLETLLSEADPNRTRGVEVTLREALDAGQRRLGELDEEPHVRAALSDVIGRVYVELGLYEEAQSLLEEAIAYRAANNDGSPAAELALASSQVDLTRALIQHGRPEEGIQAAESAVALRERHLGLHDEVARALDVLADALDRSTRFQEAERVHRRAIAVIEAIHGPDSVRATEAKAGLASMMLTAGELDVAEAIFVECLAASGDPRVTKDPRGATLMHVLSSTYAAQGRYEEARELAQGSLEVREAVLGEDHPHVMFSLMTLAEIHCALGEPELAEPLSRRGLEIGTRTHEPNARGLGWIRFSHAGVLERLERYAEQVELMERAVANLETTEPVVELVVCWAYLGSGYRGLERYPEAIAAYDRSIEVGSQVEDPLETAVALSYVGRARVHRAVDRPREVRADFEAALGALGSGSGAQRTRVDILKEFGEYLREDGDDERADAIERELASLEAGGTEASDDR